MADTPSESEPVKVNQSPFRQLLNKAANYNSVQSDAQIVKAVRDGVLRGVRVA